MKTNMWKLQNIIKNYDWGSINELSKLFNINNPEHKPMAEIWMGTHPAGVSTAIDKHGYAAKLDEIIKQHPVEILGEESVKKYASLPYLFKIISAKEPLSIQVHPSLNKARLGFEKENDLAIPLESPNRNYKDANHKPELIYAITPFWAMNGFRPIKEILTLFNQLNIPIIDKEVDLLAQNQTASGLKRFFSYLLTLNIEIKQKAIDALMIKIEYLNVFPYSIIKEIAKKYPNDSGLFSVLLLNIIELLPGQAMFLKAETPHAYLKGTGVEIMANSDNVLRAGFTSKHIDINELLDNTNFHSIKKSNLLTEPTKYNNILNYSVPVNDFAFEIIQSTTQKINSHPIVSAEILLCIEGKITISTSTDSFTISAGESVFIASCARSFNYQGNGKLACAFNH